MGDLDDLNAEQRAAVLHRGGPLLVLAGAGSGKTRVIVHRIASLVAGGVPAWSILAVTFTNKAAGEMRERAGALLGPRAEGLWVSTFHAAGAAILHREAEAAGLSPRFSIYDETDQLGLARHVLREAGRESDAAAGRDLLASIDRKKSGMGDPPDGGTAVLIDRYERALRAANAVDFGDLLVLPVELFAQKPEVLERWRRRFSHVLVDEFQDTNRIQYRLLKLLCPDGTDLCVVGDDDQSIYGWRGAEVSNILGFENDFPGATVVKLEHNYRSDGNILAAARAVIAQNPHRHEKTLWTDRPAGARIGLLVAGDDYEEADRIAAFLAERHGAGVPFGEMAVFYRINAQSRVLEEGLRLARVPYVVVRGRSFYERAEIKDAVAYLRLLINPRSDADLLRIINSPPRKIGEATVERLSRQAGARGLCLYEALAEGELAANADLDGGARGRLGAFRQLLDGLIATSAHGTARDATEAVLTRTGLLDRYARQEGPEGQERVENLRELLRAAAEADARLSTAAAPGPVEPGADAGEESDPLLSFLEEIALLGDADQETGRDRVSLMTLHAAKGLEFDVVAIPGMEEGVFPHSRAIAFRAGDEELHEERRLCYVGFTRARRRLVVSCAFRRALFGEPKRNPPSRFLREVPAELLDGMLPSPERRAVPMAGEPTIDRSYDQTWRGSRGPARVRRAIEPAAPRDETTCAAGATVRHAVFGVGKVVAADGEGPGAKLTVRFPSVGDKRIVARFVTPV